jgi:hypothetical protein
MPKVSHPISGNNRNYFIALIACAISGIILFAYVFIRAYSIPITHDEAFSWNHVATHSVMEIISYNTSPGPATPNNHILNSLLMKFFGWLFHPSVFALRLPNLIAYLFFLVFSFLILKRLKNPILMVAGFWLLNIDPYVLEFFSLARGYGLSNAFCLGTIYFLLEWKENRTRKNLFFTFFLAFFSVIANFSLLHFYLGVCIVVAFILIVQQPKDVKGFVNRMKDAFRKLGIPIVATIFLGFVLFEPLRKILKWHETFGGLKGFWADTVDGLVSAFCSGQSYTEWLHPLLKIFILISMLAIILGIIKSFYKKELSSNAMTICLLLLLPVFIHLLEHFLFGTEFLIARTGQYFVPLFIVAFIFSCEYVIGKTTPYFMAILAFGGVAHLYNCENFTHTSEWQFDCDSKAALDFIRSSVQQSPRKHVQVGITWLLEPGLNYYRKTENLTWLDTITREGVEKKEYDIYYVLSSDTTLLENKGKQMLKRYPLSNTYILQ